MPTRGDAFLFLQGEWAVTHGPVSSLLYVGHRSDTRPWWAEEFSRALGGPTLAVLDLSPENLQSASGITPRLYTGDVRDPAVVSERFGLVFWDEGPEHVPMSDALAGISMLASRHDRVLVSCPWGYQAQGSGPTDLEFHHWGPMPEDLESIGMETRCFGSVFPSGHGNLIAWTR